MAAPTTAPAPPEDDQRRRPSDRHTYDEPAPYEREFEGIKKHDTDEQLRGMEEGLKGSDFEHAEKSFNKQAEKQDTGKGASPDQLKTTEETGATPASGGGFSQTIPTDGLYNPGGKGKSKVKGKGKGRGFVKRHKWKIIAGLGLSGASGGAVLLLNLGSLLLPTLSFNMDDNRLKRVTRNVMVSTDVVVKAKLALASTGDPAYQAFINAYRDDGTGLLSKFNKLRPAKVAEQLLIDAQFKTQERRIPGTNISRQRITSVTLGDVTAEIPENNFNWAQAARHPKQYWDSFWNYRRDTRALAKNFLLETNPDVTRTTKKFQRMVVVSRAAKAIREHLKIRKWRWSKADVEAANREPPNRQQARIAATQDSYNQTTDDGARPRRAAAGDSAATEELDRQNACMADPDCTSRVVQDGDGLAPDVKQSVSTRFNANSIRGVINTLGIVSEFGYLFCLVYDSSIAASQEVIDAKNGMSQAGYASGSAAADQQRYTAEHDGDPRVNAALTGGLNDQANADGGANQSNIMRRANGQPYDTSQTLSPESSAAGMYGTDALSFMPSGMRAAFGSSAGQGFCNAVGNIWVAGGITVAELLASLIPGAGQAIKAGGTVSAKIVAKQVASQFGQVLKRQFSKRSIAEMGALATAAELTTVVSRAVTLQRMGAGYNGAAQGADLLNQWDAGATRFAQDADRLQNGSRPLTTEEYNEVNARDETFSTAILQDQSIFQRYFAMSNPGSLLRRAAVTGYAGFSMHSLSSVVQNAAAALNPTALFGKLPFFTSATSYAADSTVTKDYGVVQWGWPNDEEEAYTSDPGYAPLYNEKVLDDSGRRGELEDKYGKCFDPATGSMGTLLADEHIYRDNAANVVADRGDCAPDNLGDSGPDNDGQVTFKNEEAQLVFRLRISQRNNQAIDQLLDIQDPQPDNTAQQQGGGGQVNADGYAFPVEPGTKRDYVDLPCNSNACHHDGTPAFDLYFGPTGNMDGKAVYAISDGKIVNANVYHVAECYSIQFLSNDGFYYWYGHLQNPRVKAGDTVTAGQQIAEVARNSLGAACRGGRDHLHIDRGCVINGVPQTGGRKSCRDPNFVDFMNDMWDKLPPP